MKFKIAVFSLIFAVFLTCFGLFSMLEDGIVSDVKGVSLAIPIPAKLLGASPATVAKDLWRPEISRLGARGNLDMDAIAAISYDVTSNRMLYGKNIEKKLPLASLTKIMTAVVALENEPLNKMMTVNSRDLVGESVVGLRVGEELPMSELLYGLILVSGNDAAEVIARNSTFGRENFIYLMNKKAESLGLSNTRFTNPSGLEGDGSQYSTAYDLLVMTKYALGNAEFAKIVSTVEYTIPENNKNREYYLFNETNLLTSYPGVKGVKTGYTYEAGMCLVTYLEYGGHKIIAVVLNSPDRRQEMKDLLDYSLNKLGVEPPVHL